MRTPNKAQLAERLNRLQAEATVSFCALNDLINGKVTWFGRGKVRIGICRPCEASGGIVLDRFEDYTCAYYWESWYQGVRDYFGTDKDTLTKRELAMEANSFVLGEQRKEMEAA